MRHGELVVLGLLAAGPRHGYELVGEIRSMRVQNWARIGASTVYAVLERLERRGLLERSVTRSGNRPERQVHELTEAGRERLAELVERALSSPEPVYSDRLVGAVFARGVFGPAEARERLETAIEERDGALARLRKVAKATSGPGEAVVRFSVEVLEAERRLLQRLEREPVDDEPGPPDLSGD